MSLNIKAASEHLSRPSCLSLIKSRPFQRLAVGEDWVKPLCHFVGHLFRVGFLLDAADNVQQVIDAIILQLLHYLLSSALAIMLQQEQSLFFGNLNNLQASVIHRIARNLQMLINKLHLYHDPMSVDHFVSLHLYPLYLTHCDSVTYMP